MSSKNPVDPIEGKNKLDTSDPILVYFFKQGDLYDFAYYARTHTDYEIAQLWSIFEHLETFLDVEFQITTDRDSADLQLGIVDGRVENAVVLHGIPIGRGMSGGHFHFPDHNGNGGQGALNMFGLHGWSDKPGGQFDEGGTYYQLALHELGHGLGLGHPHDTGNSSKVMDPSYGLDQSVYTVMSYTNIWNGESWSGRPDNPGNFSAISTFSALDMAALQNMYGANTTHAAGDDVYSLAATRAAARGYQTIWDTGGTDRIEYKGDADAVIDLRAATLEYEKGGGGFISWVWKVPGGYTIAHGVVIENATSGNGDDRLTGNEADNVLDAGGGDDTLIGNAGDDTLTGGAGADTFRYSSSAFGADTITDFEDGTDVINFKDSGLRYTDLTISNNGQDKVIDTGSGNTITLTGQASASIDAADFSFNAKTIKTIQVSINDVTVTEGGVAQFTIELNAVSGKDVSVNWATSDGTAAAGNDYTGQSGQTLTIAAGQQRATVDVQTSSDSLDEDDETFTVTLSSPTNATLGDDTGEATITDDDSAPSLSIDDVTVTEGGIAQFTIELDAVSGKDVTVNWATSDGTATAGSDYTAEANQSLTIAAGQQSAAVSVQTTDDSDDETNETFTVALSGATNATISDVTGEATITDNDDPPSDNKYATLIATLKGYAGETQHGDAHVTRWKQALAGLGDEDAIAAGYTPMTADEAEDMADTYSASRWNPVVEALREIEKERAEEEAANTPPVASIDDVAVTEGGQAQFTVSLDKTWSDDVTLTWGTSDGTATDGSDYTGQSGQSLTIAAGQQSATFNVQTTGDSLDEDDETFTVTLSSPTNATLGDDTGEATITDDDSAPSLSIDDVTVTEGGIAQFTIELDAVSGKDVTVNWATSDGTATAGSDYTAEANQSLTIAAGQQSAAVSVQTTDDSDDETNETFTVALSGATNATISDVTGEATITDNDDPPSDNKYATLIATLKGYAGETQHGDAHVTRWKQALAGLGDEDAIAAGYTPMTADEAEDMADTYTASRWNPVVAALKEIEAEQTANTLPVASIDDVVVTEGGQAQFTVNLDKTWSDDVALTWATSDGTATAGNDYTGQSGQTLTIAAGQQRATVSVQTTDDGDDEVNETFTVELSGASNATLGDATGEATITDNDDAPPPPPPPPPPVLPVASINDVIVTEGGQARFTVSLDKTWTNDVTLTWGTSEATATDGADYTGQSGQALTIAAGQQSATLTVQTTEDSEDENDETFTVTLSNPANATLGDGSGLATIEDNDEPPGPDDWNHNGLTLTGTNGFDFLRGSSDNDLIDGRGGADLIEGDPGDDRMTGGGGADGFIFVRKHGHDVITDFNPAEGDSIRFSGVGFSSFDQMLDHAEQDGEDVVIYTSPGDKAHSLTLLDVQLDELDASQFRIFGGPQSSLFTAQAISPQVTARLSSPAPAFSLGDGGVGEHDTGLDEFGIGEMLGGYCAEYLDMM